MYQHKVIELFTCLNCLNVSNLLLCRQYKKKGVLLQGGVVVPWFYVMPVLHWHFDTTKAPQHQPDTKMAPHWHQGVTIAPPHHTGTTAPPCRRIGIFIIFFNLPLLNWLQFMMTFSAFFLAMQNHSLVLLRYLYSTARSLTRIGPSGSRQAQGQNSQQSLY